MPGPWSQWMQCPVCSMTRRTQNGIMKPHRRYSGTRKAMIYCGGTDQHGIALRERPPAPVGRQS
jgi:hypothetical protein